MSSAPALFRICHLNILWPQDVGVLSKLAQEARALQEAAGREVSCDCLVVVNARTWDPAFESPYFRVMPVLVPWPPPLEGLLLPIVVWKRLQATLRQYDAVVARWTKPVPAFLQVASRQAVFTEHHTKELEEMATRKGYKPLVRTLFERVYGPRILRRAKGIIAVSDEIRQYELGRAGCEKPSVVISNGIYPEEIPFRPAPLFAGGSLEIGLVSSHIAPWHGLDRLLWGLKNWGGREPRLRLHLIGRVATAQRAEIDGMDLGDQVIVHGVLRGREFDRALAPCHLAVGGLGLHRKKFFEHSELKTREYTARGLPFAMAYQDPDFPAGLDWVLRLPADETPIEMAKLVDFAAKLARAAKTSQEMREFAAEKLHWKIKMRQLIQFVRENM